MLNKIIEATFSYDEFAFPVDLRYVTVELCNKKFPRP